MVCQIIMVDWWQEKVKMKGMNMKDFGRKDSFMEKENFLGMMDECILESGNEVS